MEGHKDTSQNELPAASDSRAPSEPQSRSSSFFRRHKNSLSIIILFLFWVTFSISEFYFYKRSSFIILALRNLNVIFALVLVLLIGRNIFRLYFERSRKFRTKLVSIFLAVSLIPSIFLFYVASGHFKEAIQRWFSTDVSKQVDNIKYINEELYGVMKDRIVHFSRELSNMIREQSLLNADRENDLRKLMDNKLLEYGLNGLQVFTAQGEELFRKKSDSSNEQFTFLLFDDEGVQQVLDASQSIENKPVLDPRENIMYVVQPINSQGKIKQRVGVVVTYMVFPEGLVDRILLTEHQVLNYRKQYLTKHQIQDTYILALSIVTLVIIFSAIWLSVTITRSLSAPIEHLAVATKAVAGGNLDYRLKEEVRRDEIGQLFKSFNQMTADIWKKEALIVKTNLELQESNKLLEEKHLHLEKILEEINSGVISLDRRGHIVKINKTASRMLQIEPGRVVGEYYRKAFATEHLGELRELIGNLMGSEVRNISREIQFASNRQIVHAAINITQLLDMKGYTTGILVFMEDLTQLTKAQKAAAWQEVARRIAHEIKNPLTPIQLSAQRLIKKFTDFPIGEDKIFTECTRTILQEVHGLQTLVNEFSRFARLPEADPQPNDLNQIVRDTLSRYDGGTDGIVIDTVLDESLPLINVDQEQIKRVIINLMDNALQAMTGGRIEITTEYVPFMRMVKLTVSDTGPGIKPEDKERLFMPYFSTKGNGTGLGLAIVNRIISDHYGYIRVLDNEPHGTRFIIEIPIGMISSKGW